MEKQDSEPILDPEHQGSQTHRPMWRTIAAYVTARNVIALLLLGFAYGLSSLMQKYANYTVGFSNGQAEWHKLAASKAYSVPTLALTYEHEVCIMMHCYLNDEEYVSLGDICAQGSTCSMEESILEVRANPALLQNLGHLAEAFSKANKELFVAGAGARTMFEDAKWILDWMFSSGLYLLGRWDFTLARVDFILAMYERSLATVPDLRMRWLYWIFHRICSLLISGSRYILRMCGLNIQSKDLREVFRRQLRIDFIRNDWLTKALTEAFDAVEALQESHKLFFENVTSAEPHLRPHLDHGVISCDIKVNVDALLGNMSKLADTLREFYSTVRDSPFANKRKFSAQSI